MNGGPLRLCFFVAPLMALGIGVTAFVPFDFPRGFDVLGFCCILGTMYVHTVVAAAWAAWGPLRLAWRVPLSLVWVAALPLAFVFNSWLYPPQAFTAQLTLLLAACFGVQWLLVQAVLWGLIFGGGVRLVRRDPASGSQFDARQWQFGIRQLLVLTALVGVLLGIGRALVLNFSLEFRGHQEFPCFIFLSGVALVEVVPLLLAALLPRWSVIVTVVTLGLVAGATAGEETVMRWMIGDNPCPEIWHMIYINTATAIWVLLFVAAIRLGGYRLTRFAFATGESRAA